MKKYIQECFFVRILESINQNCRIVLHHWIKMKMWICSFFVHHKDIKIIFFSAKEIVIKPECIYWMHVSCTEWPARMQTLSLVLQESSTIYLGLFASGAAGKSLNTNYRKLLTLSFSWVHAPVINKASPHELRH